MNAQELTNQEKAAALAKLAGLIRNTSKEGGYELLMEAAALYELAGDGNVAELVRAGSKLPEALDCLRHAKSCAVCAHGDWSDCEAGQEALDLLAAAEAAARGET